MFNEPERVNNTWADKISNRGYDIMHILLGKMPDDTTFDEMLQLWLISGKHISNIYRSIITGRL